MDGELVLVCVGGWVVVGRGCGAAGAARWARGAQLPGPHGNMSTTIHSMPFVASPRIGEGWTTGSMFSRDPAADLRDTERPNDGVLARRCKHMYLLRLMKTFRTGRGLSRGPGRRLVAGDGGPGAAHLARIQRDAYACISITHHASTRAAASGRPYCRRARRRSRSRLPAFLGCLTSDTSASAGVHQQARHRRSRLC